MWKRSDRAPKEGRCIAQRGMGTFVHQRVREVIGKRLGDYEIGRVSARYQHRRLGFEVLRERCFQVFVNRMIARGQARGGDVQPKLFQPADECPMNPWIISQPVITAAPEIAELRSPMPYKGAIGLLKGWCGRLHRLAFV
jgi:hypothetical protein